MGGYGQHCPVAKAAEVLDQRWTLLVLRELVVGSNRFNDIHRGVPRMSRTLLSKRLRELERHGVLERRETASGSSYELTVAGEELLPVLEAVGEWGVRWLSDLSNEDLDPVFLMVEIQRGVDHDALPSGRTVLAMTFHDADPGMQDWWLVLSRDGVDVCDEDPGLRVDVTIDTPIRTFARVWRGDLAWSEALGDGGMRVEGPSELRRLVSTWFRLSHFASTPRP